MAIALDIVPPKKLIVLSSEQDQITHVCRTRVNMLSYHKCLDNLGFDVSSSIYPINKACFVPVTVSEALSPPSIFCALPPNSEFSSMFVLPPSSSFQTP